MFIKKVRVKNFRSIRDDEFNAKNINIIVGRNDAGKSNYLKALNLFFNGQTDFKQPFRFDIDFCKFTTEKKKQAQQVNIKITFALPSKYKDRKVSWEKTWRKEGFHIEKFKNAKGKELSGKTKTKTWLKNLKFRYVPAGNLDVRKPSEMD